MVNKLENKIVGVRFISGVKVYHFSCAGFNLKRGDYVVVENQQGEELARVVYPDVKIDVEKKQKKIEKDKESPEDEMSVVVRMATDNDKKKTLDFHKRKHEYIETASALANKLNIKVRFIDVSCSLDASTRLLFMFVADGRVDFRDLLTQMSRKFGCSIRLYQVGPRDAARIVGGVGVCGQQLCCRRFLNKFESITMEMAREQDLVNVGSNKISGVCGKLLCCLDYELKLYKELKKGYPRVGQKVIVLEKDYGQIIERNVLLRTVTVELENGTRSVYAVDEIRVIVEKNDDNKK